ncbi:hypothetical protein [Streptomyces sp. NPDC059850]|uniref:hypothetical protein n=1 Tax=Streptomyces sp. NPDC059850 TaxID=3346970 RepID=UPI00365FA6EB
MESLRRLPWTSDDGKDAFVAPGDGIVNHMADALEAELVETAKADAERARSLAEDPKASAVEMRVALRFLAHSLDDTAMVADLRAERLPSLDSEEAAL